MDTGKGDYYFQFLKGFFSYLHLFFWNRSACKNYIYLKTSKQFGLNAEMLIFDSLVKNLRQSTMETQYRRIIMTTTLLVMLLAAQPVIGLRYTEAEKTKVLKYHNDR